jgi:hypothetical protein
MRLRLCNTGYNELILKGYTIFVCVFTISLTRLLGTSCQRLSTVGLSSFQRCWISFRQTSCLSCASWCNLNPRSSISLNLNLSLPKSLLRSRIILMRRREGLRLWPFIRWLITVGTKLEKKKKSILMGFQLRHWKSCGYGSATVASITWLQANKKRRFHG